MRAAVQGEVRFDEDTRWLYSRDASMYAIEPLGVVFPRDRRDVAETVRQCHSFGVAALPRGAGTSLAGQTVGQAVVLDLSRHLNRVLDIDPTSRTARVQPGVVQEQLNSAAERFGLMFGPDTSTANRATIGGMIGNNSAGSQSVRYGMTADHVLALEVVLSDGTITTFQPLTEPERRARALTQTLDGRIHAGLPDILHRYREAIATDFPPYWRRSGGYPLDRLASGDFDLARFVVGSEGTLVVVTEATVGLVPRPLRQTFVVGHFDSVAAAIAATDDALACEPVAVELIDRYILDLAAGSAEFAGLGRLLVGAPAALLFVSFAGDSEAEVDQRAQRLTALWDANRRGYHTLHAHEPETQRQLLNMRRAGLGLLMAAGTGTRRPLAFVEDTAVEPALLPEYTARLMEILAEHGLSAGIYGHCSVGCLHVRPFVDLASPGQTEVMRSVAEKVADLVRSYGGANSSEHGDGLARSEFNPRLFGAALYQAMREVKRLFDPQQVMNPGKIVDAPPMTAHLRDANLAVPAQPATSFHYDAGDMRSAVDRCMNIGACRKTATGVMCPSYMATRDERHSTRGRAAALMKALSAPDPRAALADDGLHEALDLCLECKACKRECPLSVDMATLKSEALAFRHQREGIPLRSRLFASVRTLNVVGARFAPLANAAARQPALRRLAERRLGITASRPLPELRRQTLMDWFADHRPLGSGDAGEVVVVADSFTAFSEPEVGIAAIELLELAGHRVRLHSAGCCGRPAISKGLLPMARRQAAALVTALAGAADRGVPIVGVEPSCVLTLRDEYPQLLGGSAATGVARLAGLVDGLLLAAAREGRLSFRPGTPPCTVVYHGHCHQRALVGTADTVALLRAVPDTTVVELDAGCCGMAGSFGFEAEHYPLSMDIGELRLFPALRARSTADLVLASGVSCRQQIAHGARRRACHPVSYLRERVVDYPLPQTPA